MNSASHFSLLVVDDEPDLRTLYELALLREGYDVDSAGSVEEAWQALQARSYSALITDMRLPDGTGLDLLRRLDELGRRERVIIITAYGSPENAVQALKAGAFDYLTKPVDLRQFRTIVASALDAPRPTPPSAAPSGAAPDAVARSAMPLGVPPFSAPRRMAGGSMAMQQVRQLVDKVARSMAPVLIQGESGTGKELVARSIHESGSRAGRPFIAVNCGAIPEQLLEAEFFGYRKGAFTGAAADREGFFQAAAGGSLFLDEIGDLPLSMQSKLLRAIQERAVRAVGAVHEVPVDVRIISASHKDLAQEVQAARFRQDLFYRLNVISIRVPPLRERADDLPALVEHLLERIATESGLVRCPRLTPAALASLEGYAFPGNVRELENLLHRAVALSAGAASELALIDGADLGIASHAVAMLDPVQTVVGHAAAWDGAAVPAADAQLLNDRLAGRPGNRLDDLPDDLAAHLDHIEREVLVKALQAHRFNRTAAGASLGLTLRQIRYRMGRLGIQTPGENLADAVAGANPDADPDAGTDA